MNKPRIERREVHGWIALDKAVGQTSTDAVAALKRMFRAKKAGHAGTLDPAASGVLVVGVEKATKLLTYVTGTDKTYRASIRLGAATVTDDAEGDVTSTAAPRMPAKPRYWPTRIRAVVPR